VANAIARETGFSVLASDRVRKELAGISPDERRRERFAEGIYSVEFTEKTYSELMKRASALLSEGRPVILDATFSKARLIESAWLAAVSNGADFHVIECAAPDAAVRERMKKRHAGEAQGAVVSDADWEIYLRQKGVYEKWEKGAIEIDTTAPLNGLVSTVAAQIFG
jgi:predicted kinase